LATVQGTYPYATTVSFGGSEGDRLDSECSCPIGGTCKHCVAVVAEYLDAVAADRPVPVASEDDPRWAKLEEGGGGGGWEEDEYE
ncbi:SWIM zinc finger family protein, partial [Staphylococcus pseudintermedius]|uniref:SWIM zinc finger family protein n=1 Tax=Staphylococcus pseudintermedius TaxID=283734 RepID=UPI0036F345F9